MFRVTLDVFCLPNLARELQLTSGKYLFDQNAIVYSNIRPNLNTVCIPGFVGICRADMYPMRAESHVDKVSIPVHAFGPFFKLA